MNTVYDCHTKHVFLHFMSTKAQAYILQAIKAGGSQEDLCVSLFRDRMMEMVTACRLDPSVPYTLSTSSLQRPQPQLPANIATALRPTLQEA